MNTYCCHSRGHKAMLGAYLMDAAILFFLCIQHLCKHGIISRLQSESLRLKEVQNFSRSSGYSVVELELEMSYFLF